MASPRLAILLLALAGCSLSPLQGRIEVGKDAFVVFVAEGSDGRTDLFAGLPSGGELSRVTFTPVAESHPALTRGGDMLAFLRYPPPTATATPRLVVLNLLNGAEREIATEATAGPVDALAWAPDRDALLLRGGGVTWRIPFPTGSGEPRRLDGAARAAADSLLDVLLGEPAFSRADACADGGVCVTGPSGVPVELSARGRDPFRWGSDSLAWFEDGQVIVRPLGPGAPHAIAWKGTATRMRQGAYSGTPPEGK